MSSVLLNSWVVPQSFWRPEICPYSIKLLYNFLGSIHKKKGVIALPDLQGDYSYLALPPPKDEQQQPHVTTLL